MSQLSKVMTMGAVLFTALAITSFVRKAEAHAFLDHAVPAVGSSRPNAPAVISLWFTEQLEPAFSSVEVRDQSGKRVDAGDAKVDPHDPTELHATLKPVPSGTYKVLWHVVSIDTHRTEGDFTFTVSP